MGADMGIFEGFLKSTTTPELVSVGGALRPEAANLFIDLVMDQTPFLQRIYIHRMNKLTSDLNALTITPRALVRLAEGTAASSFTSPTNKGKTLLALSMQFFAQVTFSAISDNQGNPDFENQLAGMFAKAVGNDLLDLGFNGTDDDYTGSAFLELNKGWVHLAKNNTDCVKYDVNTLSSDYIGNLKAVVQAQDALYKATSAFILNPADYEGLVEDLGSEPGGVAYIVSGSLPTFMGHEIIQVPYMPSGQVLFTPPQNIVMGINRDIQRYREIETSKRAIEYTFDMATDFAFLNDAAVVIGYNVT